MENKLFYTKYRLAISVDYIKILCKFPSHIKCHIAKYAMHWSSFGTTPLNRLYLTLGGRCYTPYETLEMKRTAEEANITNLTYRKTKLSPLLCSLLTKLKGNMSPSNKSFFSNKCHSLLKKFLFTLSKH